MKDRLVVAIVNFILDISQLRSATVCQWITFQKLQPASTGVYIHIFAMEAHHKNDRWTTEYGDTGFRRVRGYGIGVASLNRIEPMRVDLNVISGVPGSTMVIETHFSPRSKHLCMGTGLQLPALTWRWPCGHAYRVTLLVQSGNPS